MTPDLANTRAMIVVFAMEGCGPCDEFVPRLVALVDRYKAAGYPFVVWSPGTPIVRGAIPVLIYDAAATDDGVQEFADRLGVTATPTVCLLTKASTAKVEGALDDEQTERLLVAALRANR